MGKIKLNNMIFYAHHGYYQAERELGQKFQVDLELECNFSKAIKSDELHDAVVRLLNQRKKTLATVEWGTHGLVAQWLASTIISESWLNSVESLP